MAQHIVKRDLAVLEPKRPRHARAGRGQGREPQLLQPPDAADVPGIGQHEAALLMQRAEGRPLGFEVSHARFLQSFVGGAPASLCPCLAGEKSALAPVAPAIAGERAVLAHDPMARNGQRDPVRGARFADRIRFVRFADALGDLAIARPGACRNRAERLPDALLESRALDIERQIQTARRVLDQGYDLGKDGLQPGIIGDRVGIETLVPKLAR